jgi:hypothetical protein
MNRTFALLAVLLAFSALVVGCGRGAPAADTTQGTPVAQPAATGDAQADAAIDATVTDENDDVELGELI